MFEARLKRKHQGKKKQLTAEEKLLRFKAMNEAMKRKWQQLIILIYYVN